MSQGRCHIEKRFHPENCPSWILAGSQRSGKTTFCRKLVREIHKYYNQVILISGTPYNNHIFNDIGIPNLTTLSFEEVDDEGEAINRGPEYLKKIFQFQNGCKKDGVDYRTLLIMEDFTNYISVKDKTYKALASFSRHIGLSVIYICQTVSSNIPTCIRNNAQIWVVFSGLAKPELEGISGYFPAGSKYNFSGFSSFHYDYNIKSKPFSFFVMLRNETKDNLIFCRPLEKHGRLNIREERTATVSHLIRQAIDG